MQKSNKTAVIVATAVAVWWFLLRGGKASAAVQNLTGEKVERTKSWEGSTQDWAKTRFGAAIGAVKAHWFGEHDDETAKQIALSMLAHWSIETGAGAYEWNYNVANINATGSQPYVLVKDVDGTQHAQRSFEFLQAGVDAYVELLATSRYAPAAKKLANDPTSTDWFIALGHAGWFDPTKAKPPSSWEAAASMYAARRALLAQYATM